MGSVNKDTLKHTHTQYWKLGYGTENEKLKRQFRRQSEKGVCYPRNLDKKTKSKNSKDKKFRGPQE